MSESYYHPRRSDRSEIKREERLPSIHHVVDVGVPSHSKSSPYDFNDVKRSLPRVSNGPYSHHSGHTQHHHSGSTLPPIHSGNSEPRIAHASNPYHSTHSSTPRSHRDDTYHRPSYNYPQTSHGVFTALYPSRSGDLVTVSTSSSPLGIVRSSELPDDGDYDPKKKHKCPECGKRFDRPSGLEQHRLRHTGERPYPCPVPGCDSTFTVRSNMTRHVRTQHNCEPGDASRHDRYSGVHMPPRRSSDRSAGPIPIGIRY